MLHKRPVPCSNIIPGSPQSKLMPRDCWDHLKPVCKHVWWSALFISKKTFSTVPCCGGRVGILKTIEFYFFIFVTYVVYEVYLHKADIYFFKNMAAVLWVPASLTRFHLSLWYLHKSSLCFWKMFHGLNKKLHRNTHIYYFVDA